MKDFQPLNDRGKEILTETARLYRMSGIAKTADFTSYEAINPKGISAAAILDCYNSCMLQPVPTFGESTLILLPRKRSTGWERMMSVFREKLYWLMEQTLRNLFMKRKNF